MNRIVKTCMGFAVYLITVGVFAQAPCPNDNSFNGFPNPFNTTIGTPATSTNSWGGDYLNTDVVSGETYSWTTCGNTASFDTEFTLRQDGSGTLLAFNSSFCGNQPEITWAATFTGRVRLNLDQNPCAHNSIHQAVTLNRFGPLDGNQIVLRGFAEEEGNHLAWNWEGEDVATVYVQRSPDGNEFENWQAFHQMDGKNPAENEVLDASPTSERTFYRLRVLHKNGQETYSNVVELFKGMETEISVWPNPSEGRMRLELSGGKGTATVQVFDLTGKMVLEEREEVVSGIWQKHITLPDVPPGMYILQARRGTVVARQKIEVR